MWWVQVFNLIENLKNIRNDSIVWLYNFHTCCRRYQLDFKWSTFLNFIYQWPSLWMTWGCLHSIRWCSVPFQILIRPNHVLWWQLNAPFIEVSIFTGLTLRNSAVFLAMTDMVFLCILLENNSILVNILLIYLKCVTSSTLVRVF